MVQATEHPPDHVIEEAAKELLTLVRELGSELHLPRTAIDGLDLDSSFHEDLRLDSLTQVEFFSRIEKQFGVTLPEKAFTHISTPRDLLEFILAAERLDHSKIASSVSRLMLRPASKIPHHPETLIDVLDWHAKNNPDRPHIKFYGDGAAGETMTYIDLKENAETLAAGLQQKGLRPKDTVMILLPSGKDYVVAFFAILIAGGIPVPLPPPSRHQHLQIHLFQHQNVFSSCQARFLITDEQTKTGTKEQNIELEFIRNLLTPDDLSSAAGRLIRPPLSGQDIAYLQYTPGVTGEPKGVALTHANVLANIQAIGEWGHLSSQDVLVSWLPLYHNMGLIGAWFISLFYAVLLVNMPPLFFLISPDHWLWAMHHFRATLAVAPNFAYAICVQQVNEENLQGLDLSLLKIAINSTEFVLPDTIEKFNARFSDFGFSSCAMTPMFSLAESTFALTLPPVERAVRIDQIERDAFAYSGHAMPTTDQSRALQFVSCGSPLAGHEIRVVDTLGSELPERHQGRLEFRGPSAAAGYYRNPQQTRYLHHGDWLDSGDLAYIANGELFVTGRAEELIHHRGRNIHPFELEQAISRLPGIIKGSVALFGHRSSHPRKHQLIVLAGTREQDAANLKAMRARIEEATAELTGAVPDDIVLTLPDVIPKTAGGQIRHTACRHLYETAFIDNAYQAGRRQGKSRHPSMNAGHLRQWAQVVSSRLYGLFFWTMALPFIAVTWCFLMLCPIASWRWHFARRAAKTLFHLTGISIRVEGLDNLPPKHQPCIFVCNHSSYLDGFILMQVLPTKFSFVAKAGLARHFFSRTFLGRLDTIFIDRFDKEKGIEGATNMVHQALDGKSFLIFPEGTFTRKAGLLPFHLGAFVTACDTGLPIVPVTLHGVRFLLRDKSWLPRHVAVSAIIDKPIDPNQFLQTKKQPDRLSEILALRDAVREQMLKQVGEPDLVNENFPI